MVLNAGVHFLIPVGIPHAVAVLNDRPGHGLVVAAPSGFARQIAATGTLSEAEISESTSKLM
ncbi:MAG: hypothetical protein JOZ78_04510 [Chroococcidiopsidaceae cyanobacterium CP_BM_ER_R8_30]|nr:hypothetical protein [Chroococcidiopsidaceae cyanobacterium CP_BM_ER_R8_30]